MTQARQKHRMGDPRRGKPEWLRVAPRAGEEYFRLRSLMRRQELNTICEEGRCPNTAECWNQGTATFMILGDQCTRRCTFCNVGYGWTGNSDPDEARRLAETVASLGLRHVVVTSVDRDDLEDGGASIFVESVGRIRQAAPDCEIELLIPDFREKDGAFERVAEARPDVLAHNLETVPSLYRGVRPRSDYGFSLGLLRRAAALPEIPLTKTSIMVGLGETREQLRELMGDVANAGVDILTVGQYLQPSVRHHRVERFYAPPEFEEIAEEGRALGLPWVEAGPLVRSSYHAAEQTRALG